jgi:hypothetical protein
MGLGTALMPRIGVRPLVAASLFGTAGGLVLTSAIRPGSSYLGGVLPGMIILAVFCGLGFAPIMNAALHQVTDQDSSLASAVQNTVAQLGSALGLACLVMLALRRTATQVHHGMPASLAAAHGYALSFRISAALLVGGGVLALMLFEGVSSRTRNPLAETAPAPSARQDQETIAA